jgi:nucleoside-diphosphate-sugar epimerase
MRVVVTGATGMVGSEVVRALAADPDVDEVVGLARRVPEQAPDGVEFRRCDVRGDDLEPELRGAHAVVHLAWMIHPAWSAAATWTANVGGSARVLEAAAVAGVRVLAYAGSLGCYAPGAPARGPVDETWPTTGIPSLPYGHEKAMLEQLCERLAAHDERMRVVRLRAGFVMQRENAARIRRVMLGPLVPHLATSSAVPVVPYVAELQAQGVHASDIAEAFRLAVLDHRARGPYNVVDETVLDARDVARLLGARTVRVPFGVARTAASAAFHARLQPTHPGWIDLLRHSPFLDTTRIREELGWTPRVPARDALRELLDGLRDGAGGPTPPLDAGGRRHEVAGGVGADPR